MNNLSNLINAFFSLFSENYVELKPFFASITNSGFLVRNKGCRIPDMDPFDSAIVQFIQREKPLVCDHGNHLPLIDSNDTALHVNPDAINHFYNNSEEIDCCWRPFWRMKNEDNIVTSVRLIVLSLYYIFHQIRVNLFLSTRFRNSKNSNIASRFEIKDKKIQLTIQLLIRVYSIFTDMETSVSNSKTRRL